jgi:V8-like Glu-specific endopeptidase
MDVKEESGKVTNWELEMGSPNLLLSQGWTLNSLKVGDSVTVEGYPAKNGSKIANARKVTVSAR